jgi:hypothetical protein
VEQRPPQGRDRVLAVDGLPHVQDGRVHLVAGGVELQRPALLGQQAADLPQLLGRGRHLRGRQALEVVDGEDQHLAGAEHLQVPVAEARRCVLH